MQRKLTVIMSADVVGYSALMERDESGALARLKENRQALFDPRVAAHGGRVVKLMGDGSLIEFLSAVAAVDCALEIQEAVARAESGRPEPERLQYRIGINLGDVIVEGDDIYGEGVNLAARLQALAPPGGLALSRNVSEQVAGKLAVELEDLGQHAVKNIDRPLHVFLARPKKAVLPASSGVEAVQRRAVCVLPFVNMSGDREQEYFSDGISEDIITDLSKVSGLVVIARNSAFAFKGRHVDVREVARQLKVSHVLEGSVRKSGNRVRITAQLIDGAANTHVWAERYDRNLDDIFALQDEISQAIVSALEIRLIPEEKKAIESRRASNIEAYDKYLRARERLNSGVTAADFRCASEMFGEALTLDSDFAEARGGVLEALSHLLWYAPETTAETYQAIIETVQEAIARAPDHWTTQLAVGLMSLQQGWLAAETVFAKLAASAPSPLPRYLLAYIFASTGRSHEAVECLERAKFDAPLSPTMSAFLQQTYDSAGRASEAEAEYERTKGVAGTHEAMEYTRLLRIWDSGDVAAIKAQWRRYLAAATIGMDVMRRLVDAVDRPPVARALLREAFLDSANQDSMRMYALACHAAHFGDDELALAALRRGYVEMIPSYVSAVWLPALRSVRKTEGFKQIVRHLRFDDYWRRSGHWGDFARPLGDDDFEILR